MKVKVNKCLDVYTATVFGDDGKPTGQGGHFQSSEKARAFKEGVENGTIILGEPKPFVAEIATSDENDEGNANKE